MWSVCFSTREKVSYRRIFPCELRFSFLLPLKNCSDSFQTSKPNIFLTVERLGEVGGCSYLGGYISSGGLISGEVYSRLLKSLIDIHQFETCGFGVTFAYRPKIEYMQQQKLVRCYSAAPKHDR